MTDDGLLLEARDLSRTYRSEGSGDAVHAVRCATLRLRRGEFACPLGPSGSGKPTLLHLLGGLLAPPSGSLRVAGVDLARARGAERAPAAIGSPAAPPRGIAAT